MDEPLVLAIDFDNTIAPNSYPDLADAPFPSFVKRYHDYRRAGFRLILNTARTNPRFVDAYTQAQLLMEWLDTHGIPMDEIAMDGKPLADVYIDDKGMHYSASQTWDADYYSPAFLRMTYGNQTYGYAAGKTRMRSDRRPGTVQWIGLAGKMGAGKGTVAAVLQGLYGDAYVRGFARSVRDEAIQQGIDPSVKTPYVRGKLQEIGSKRREQDPEYWVKAYWDWAKSLKDFPNVNLIVDDVRYPNEVAFLTSKGFRVGWVDAPEEVRMMRLLRRDGAIPWEHVGHASETAFNGIWHWSFLIHNYTDEEQSKAMKELEDSSG